MNLRSVSSPGGRNAGRPARKVFYFPQPIAWAVLAISLAASAGGWFMSWKHAQSEARKKFDEGAMAITVTLHERMQSYQNLLYGAAGLFAASETVERSEWRKYVQSISTGQPFPGIDAVGFVESVPRDQVEAFVERTRADGTPNFEIREPGTEGALWVIKYIEPQQEHVSSLGWNIATDAERLGVAESARDAGKIELSGKVWIHDDVGGKQPGCLMMLPVYRHGWPIDTVSERRAALEGCVFARFVISQLMDGVMGKGNFGLHVRLSDISANAKEQLIYDNNDPDLASAVIAGEPWFRSVLPTSYGSRTWTLEFDTKPSFEKDMRFGTSGWVAAGGALISVLLFMIAWSLGSTRERALAIASEMTGALRESNQKLQDEVSERQRSEAALQHSQSLYHSLVESLPLSITRRDLEGRLIFANQRYCTRNGRKLGEIVGKTDVDLYPPELVAQRQAADRKVIETRQTVEMVEERPLANGEIRYIQAIRTPLFDGGKNVVGVLGIFWDVTDRKRAEADLEHERFLLRTLMDNLPDRIYFKDEQSRFLRNSRAHLERFGLTHASQAIGKSDFDFFTEEHAREAFEDEQRLMRTGETVSKEEKETWPDGSTTWALSTKMPLRDEGGKVIGTFGISRDITDRKRAEVAMREAKEAAEEANRAKSHFLASMSHELRTPLNSVIGFANILLKNKSGNLAASELNFLDRILANGKHLLALINQILDLSKIEARKVELRLQPLMLDELVQATVAQQESLVRDKSVRLRVDLPEQIAPVLADGEKLKQVIINLIGNALKFTEKGSVTVRVVADSETHQPVRVDVVDTGIGIPQEKLKMVFQAFQQAEVGTARKYGGTGLGLTISQALCQLMGYRIEVESKVGGGSIFSILMGARRETAGTMPPAQLPKIPEGTVTAAELKGYLVLVIDDELDSRTLLSHMIEEFGCQVITANSGEQGLHMAREFRPSLITVDLMMPQLDGWQVIRALKADPQLRDIPVVVVSVVAGENRGGIIGAVDVLQKPVVREELFAAMRRCVAFEKPRILIVDDEVDSRRMLREHLGDEACECREADNGSEALAIMDTFVPDLILLDLIMPEMDGMTFLSRVRAEARYRWIPVVVVTAKDLTVAEAERLRHTAQDVVKKGDLFQADLRSIFRRLLQTRYRLQNPG